MTPSRKQAIDIRPTRRPHKFQEALTSLVPFMKVKNQTWRTRQTCYALRTFPNLVMLPFRQFVCEYHYVHEMACNLL
jgi:hypothetical protein